MLKPLKLYNLDLGKIFLIITHLKNFVLFLTRLILLKGQQEELKSVIFFVIH
jgi:hypothetical protein